jgi:triosephosphate isomerase
MARKPFVAGNWKMNKTIDEAHQLTTALLRELEGMKTVEIVLCPPFTALTTLNKLVSNSNIKLGAQNMDWRSSGAFTGEISPIMIAELCSYVIVGHSERRAYFGENDDTVNEKIKSALANNIIPILCFGETLDENEAGKTEEVVTRQVKNGLAGIDPEMINGGDVSLVLAYEPVWAIGTGKAATVEDAANVISNIVRHSLSSIFGDELSNRIQVLYGGSVNGENAGEFFSVGDIDGALVGGASLKAGEFTKIVRAAVNSTSN